MLGFSSARYFSKLFQKYTGMLPSPYGNPTTAEAVSLPSPNPH
ncbi:AraC family transcriptional regulator [bacterium 1xD42-87]|nr:AraC family transcriptional regulator [bacterium 1xD42-87]